MTLNKEDYLKVIYHITSEGKQASNKKIAAALNVSPASVSEMIARLSKENYVVNEPYRGVYLTKKGHHRAENLVRNHRLWEVFLKEYLGCPQEEIHDHAERLEHATTHKLADYLEIFLGYPQRCPHGSIIPERDALSEQEEDLPSKEAENE